MPLEEEYNAPGAQPESQQHWIPWLQQQLEEQNIPTNTPEFPIPYLPEYNAWKEVFESYEIREETILVGHSCGAGFIARWLSENKVKVGKVVLVAPWLDPKPSTLHNGFFDFVLDPSVSERTKGISIFVSNDDDEDIQQSVRTLTDAWPSVNVLRFENKGHFILESMGTREFPELAAEVL